MKARRSQSKRSHNDRSLEQNELVSRAFMLMSFAAAAFLITTASSDKFSSSATKNSVQEEPVEASIDQSLEGSSATSIKTSPENLPYASVNSPPQNISSLSASNPSPNDSSRNSLVSNGPHLVVDLSDRKVYFYYDNKLQTTYAIAVGQPGWETPTGAFTVENMQVNPTWQHPITGEIIPPGPNNPLGSRWIGFTSNKNLEIGFHGTDQTNLLGQAVSHGCVRMRNQDIQAIYAQISVGTPVSVRS